MKKIQINENYYLSNNNLALIYIIDYKDIKTAEEYLRTAAFSELSYGQNNFGLLCQLFLKKIGDAEYMYERASKNYFAITEFIIGYNKEIEKKKNEKESIVHYSKAIQYENEPLKSWINNFIVDKRLDITKIFVVFLFNIKLVHYHLNHFQFKESTNFIVNSIFKPIYKLLFENNHKSFSFKFEIDNEFIDLINHMENIINESPFSILFGKIPINKTNYTPKNDINSYFYDGLK